VFSHHADCCAFGDKDCKQRKGLLGNANKDILLHTLKRKWKPENMIIKYSMLTEQQMSSNEKIINIIGLSSEATAYQFCGSSNFKLKSCSYMGKVNIMSPVYLLELQELLTNGKYSVHNAQCDILCTGTFLKLLMSLRLRASPLPAHRQPQSTRQFS
jgi:hypothetical protein